VHPDQLAGLGGHVGVQVDRRLGEAEPGSPFGDVAVGRPEGLLPLSGGQDLEHARDVDVDGKGDGSGHGVLIGLRAYFRRI
jgi:hypothetical protein